MLVRKLLFLQLVAVAVFITGCNMPGSRSASGDECYYFTAPGHEAPGWVCDHSMTGLIIQATGVAEMSKASIGMTTKSAYSEGLAALAKAFAVEVKILYEEFEQTTGQGTTAETVDAVKTHISEVAASQRLEGVSQVRRIVDPKGKAVYVLLGIKQGRSAERNLIAIGQRAAEDQEFRDSINNERAAWQRFLAEKARDRLKKRFEEKR